VVGVLGTAVTVLVLIPAFRDGSAYAYSLGGDGLQLFAEPVRKVFTLVLTLCVGGLVAVLSPWAVVAVPTMAWRFAADNPFYWGTDFHYSVLLMPIMAVAAIDAMQRHPWTRLPAVAALVGVTVGMFPDSPSRQYLDPDEWKTQPREVAARAVVETVPLGVRVDTDIGLMIHLVTGRDVTFIGTPGNAVPDWVVLDHTITTGPETAEQYAERRYGKDFRTVLEAGPFDVAKRG
jgi:hypothetical protein